jgi:DNA-binding transcriptional regulator YiaG
VRAGKSIKNVVEDNCERKEIMEDLNASIKKSFGEKMKISRKIAGYSRAKLAVELGVSSKTIQSWETGRTFPENMSLVPIIETKLGFFIPDILGETVREEAAKKGVGSPVAASEPKDQPKKIVRRAAVVEDEKEERKEDDSESEAPVEVDEV